MVFREKMIFISNKHSILTIKFQESDYIVRLKYSLFDQEIKGKKNTNYPLDLCCY